MLDEYLAMRRALAHKLCQAGRLLKQFVAFADLASATYFTIDLALAWASQPVGRCSPKGPSAWDSASLRSLLRRARSEGVMTVRMIYTQAVRRRWNDVGSGGEGMLIVETIGRIRPEHLDKCKSIKEIAQELNLPRNTVGRARRTGETVFFFKREDQPR